MQYKQFVSLIIVCFATVSLTKAADGPFRKRLVAGFCDSCKRISTLPMDKRSVWAVFCDLDCDGYEEMLAVDEAGKDRDGWCWGIAYQNGISNDVKVCLGDYFMMCQPEGMLRVMDKDGSTAVICLNAYYSLLNGKVAAPSVKGDVRISLTPDKRFIVQPLTYREKSFLIGRCRFVERLMVNHYVGANLICGQSALIESPEMAKHTGCHKVSPPHKLDEFVMAYRVANKIDSGGMQPVPVYVVLLDVDNDGDADLFVTSDKEMMSDGDYRWVLYINEGTGFRKATKLYWYNRSGVRRAEAIEPEIVACRSAFYRVERRFYDPSVVVLGYAGGNLHSLAYRKIIAEYDRAERALISAGKSAKTDEEWLYEVKDKLGFFPPLDVLEFFEGPEFVRMERLPELAYTSEPCLDGVQGKQSIEKTGSSH